MAVRALDVYAGKRAEEFSQLIQQDNPLQGVTLL